jgi:hypothetical protein
MWESRGFGEIPKGLVGRVGSLSLAFHSFHSPGISVALCSCVLPEVGVTPTAGLLSCAGYCGPGSFFFLLFFSR